MISRQLPYPPKALNLRVPTDGLPHGTRTIDTQSRVIHARPPSVHDQLRGFTHAYASTEDYIPQSQTYILTITHAVSRSLVPSYWKDAHGTHARLTHIDKTPQALTDGTYRCVPWRQFLTRAIYGIKRTTVRESSEIFGQ
jgi:hypothetical protein